MQMDFLKQDAEEYLKILRKLHLEYFHETDTQKKKSRQRQDRENRDGFYPVLD